MVSPTDILFITSIIAAFVGLISTFVFLYYTELNISPCYYIWMIVAMMLSAIFFTANDKETLEILGTTSTVVLVATPLFDEWPHFFDDGPFDSVPLHTKLSLLGYALFWEAYKWSIPYTITSSSKIELSIGACLSCIQVLVVMLQVWRNTYALHQR